MTCPRCNARGDRPCVEGGLVLAQYHAERVRAETRGKIDHAAEATRLRKAARLVEIRQAVATRSKP